MEAPSSNDLLLADPTRDTSQVELYSQANEQYGAAIVRLARAYEDHGDSRRDLLQEIHLALWKSLATYNRRCSLRTWVYRVAHNVATTHLLRSRRWRTRHHVSLEEIESVPDDCNCFRTLDEAQVLERLRLLIRSLSPAERQVIMLYLEGLSAAQIAEVVGISAENAATKVHRIKRILARRFHGGESNE